MHVFEHIISVLAPHRCLSCGLEGTPLCLPCTEQLPPAPKCCYKCGKAATRGLCRGCRRDSALTSIAVRTPYAGLAEQAVHRLKFERNREMAQFLGHSLAALCPAGVIAHVPTANRRVRQRGYDQAQLIARALAAQTGNPYGVLLYRQGAKRQLGQGRTVRQEQLRNAFRPAPHGSAKQTPIILVDDVVTTASTLEAAAQVLRHVGYASVHAVAFAWATRPPARPN